MAVPPRRNGRDGFGRFAASVGGELEVLALDTDEEERRAVWVSAPHDRVHIQRPSTGWLEVQVRRCAELEHLLVETDLGAEGAQVDRHEVEAVVARADRDRPGHLGAWMAPQVWLEFAYHAAFTVRSAARSFSSGRNADNLFLPN